MRAESAARAIDVRLKSNPGFWAGLWGCVFGLLGIFTVGLIFVPLAALCSIVGFFKGLAGGNMSGIGMSLLAAELAVLGF
jgi:hypothetical protein